MSAQSNSLSSTHLARVLLQFKQEFWIAVLISAVINLLMLTPTVYMLQIFDRVMISQSILTLAVVSAIIVFLYIVQGISEWLRSKLIISTGIRIDHALNEPIFRATFSDQLRSSGKSPVQAFSDLNVIRQWLTGSGLFAILDLPWTPIYVTVMFLLHPWLGWLTIGFMGVLTFFAWLTTLVTRDTADESEEEERELNKFLYTKLQNSEVIEAHGMVGSLRDQWWKRQSELMRLQVRATDLQERMSAASKQLRFLMNSLALGAGAFFVIRGEITIGAMVAASLLMSRALSPIETTVSSWRSFLAVRKSFNRIEKLLSQSVGRIGLHTVGKLSGRVELKNVVAKANSRETPVLRSLSATFPAGQTYIILGRSGAGKSTLGRVLLGIWPDVDGEVLIDGIEICHFDRDSLGPNLGYLPQDIELFQGSVALNIARMGTIDSQKVIEAAKRTDTHNFILSLSQGYDSVIEARGSNLSAGQRQRVALARAIYGSPQLVVLDEPDANLDQEGDVALREAVLSLKHQGSSIFLITHRPALLDLADQIIFMQSGGISFYGPRDVFMAKHAALELPPKNILSKNEPPADAEPIPV